MRSAAAAASPAEIGSAVPGTIDADAVGRLARCGLVAHHLDRVGGRADEREPGLGHRAREAGAFGQEPVARVDHRRPGLRRGLEDRAERYESAGSAGPIRCA